jgi:hypothetical protein
MLSSAIRIIERTPSRLVILDPPSYVFGSVFLAIGIVFVLFALPFGRGTDGPAKFNWLAALMAAPFLLVGLINLTGQTTTTLSRETGNMMVDARYIGLRFSNANVPLTSVRQATVESGGRGSRRLVAVLENGHVILLTGNTDRQGHYEAAIAINEFLGINPPVPIDRRH